MSTVEIIQDMSYPPPPKAKTIFRATFEKHKKKLGKSRAKVLDARSTNQEPPPRADSGNIVFHRKNRAGKQVR